MSFSWLWWKHIIQPNIYVAFCNHKAPSQILPHLIIQKFYWEDRLERWRGLPKVISLGKWHASTGTCFFQWLFLILYPLLCRYGVGLGKQSLWQYCGQNSNRDRFHRLFPKVMPNGFCLQSIPLGKLRVIAHATSQVPSSADGRCQWCAMRRWIRAWKVLGRGWHKEIFLLPSIYPQFSHTRTGKHRAGNFIYSCYKFMRVWKQDLSFPLKVTHVI